MVTLAPRRTSTAEPPATTASRCSDRRGGCVAGRTFAAGRAEIACPAPFSANQRGVAFPLFEETNRENCNSSQVRDQQGQSRQVSLPPQGRQRGDHRRQPGL